MLDHPVQFRLLPAFLRCLQLHRPALQLASQLEGELRQSVFSSLRGFVNPSRTQWRLLTLGEPVLDRMVRWRIGGLRWARWSRGHEWQTVALGWRSKETEQDGRPASLADPPELATLSQSTGRSAAWLARHLGVVEVVGSNPAGPT